MSSLVKFVLILLGLAYLISPADLIPEMYLPWIGWIDDSLILMCLYHLIRYGRLPSFYLKKATNNRPENKGRGPAKPIKRQNQTNRQTEPIRAVSQQKGIIQHTKTPSNPHMRSSGWTNRRHGLRFKRHIRTRPSNTTRINSPIWVKSFRPLPMKNF